MALCLRSPFVGFCRTIHISRVRLPSKTSSVAGSGAKTEGVSNLTRASLASQLVSNAYAGTGSNAEYEKILSELNRTDIRVPNGSYLFDLKRFELMLRCGLIPGYSFDQVSSYNKKFLFKIRSSVFEDFSPLTAFEQELHDHLKEMSASFNPNVVIGPYNLAFCQPGEAGVTIPDIAKIDSSDIVKLIRKCVCVLRLRSDAYAPDGQLGPDARIRSGILDALGIKTVAVPEPHWQQLRDARSKRIYLSTLIWNRIHR